MIDYNDKIKMDVKNTTKNVIFYLVKRLGIIEGRKKLMKLMFLVEHLDIQKSNLSKDPFIGNKFIIYHYGVFSFGVMDSYIELIHEGKIEDGIPIRIRPTQESEIPEDIKSRVNKVIELFGKKDGYELEIKTIEMLGLNLSNKRECFGRSIKELIK